MIFCRVLVFCCCLSVPLVGSANFVCLKVFGFFEATTHLRAKYRSAQKGWVSLSDPRIATTGNRCATCMVNLMQAVRSVIGDPLIGDPVRLTNEIIERFPNLQNRGRIDMAELTKALRWVLDRYAILDIQLSAQALQGSTKGQVRHLKFVDHILPENVQVDSKSTQLISFFAIDGAKQVVGGNLVNVVRVDQNTIEVVDARAPDRIIELVMRPLQLKSGQQTVILDPKRQQDQDPALGPQSKLIVNGLLTIQVPTE